MLKQLFTILLILLSSCKTFRQLVLPERKETAPGGNAFYKQIAAMKWNEREPMMLKEILSGNMPGSLKKLVPVHINIKDSSGEIITATLPFLTYFSNILRLLNVDNNVRNK